jgi:hypothetical protein
MSIEEGANLAYKMYLDPEYGIEHIKQRRAERNGKSTVGEAWIAVGNHLRNQMEKIDEQM